MSPSFSILLGNKKAIISDGFMGNNIGVQINDAKYIRHMER